MDLPAFRASLSAAEPPPAFSHALRALWLDARGNWDGAHDAAQADEGGAGDWVHASQGGRSRQRRLLVPARAQAGLPNFARRRMGGDRRRAPQGRKLGQSVFRPPRAGGVEPMPVIVAFGDSRDRSARPALLDPRTSMPFTMRSTNTSCSGARRRRRCVAPLRRKRRGLLRLRGEARAAKAKPQT
jgi:hypothetical protein